MQSPIDATIKNNGKDRILYRMSDGRLVAKTRGEVKIGGSRLERPCIGSPVQQPQISIILDLVSAAHHFLCEESCNRSVEYM